MGIIQTITDAVKEFFSGIGSSVVDMFDTLFKAPGSDGGLSTFAIVALTFMGLSLAIGLFYGLMKLIRR